jgi:hypothetical protein
MICNASDVIHQLDGTSEYGGIDPLEDAVPLLPAGVGFHSKGIVDVARSVCFGREEGFVIMSGVELFKDCLEVGGQRTV